MSIMRRIGGLRLPADPAELIDFGSGLDLVRRHSPARTRDHTGVDKFQAVKEARDLLLGTERDRGFGVLVPKLPSRFGLGRIHFVAGVGYGQVAAGRDGIKEPGHDCKGFVVVEYKVQYAKQRKGHGLAKV